MLFVVTAIDKPDSLALRLATRVAHFAYARETGVVRLGGPFLDDQENMAGSLIVFRVGSADADLLAPEFYPVRPDEIVQRETEAALHIQDAPTH